ncbi:MAG: helix-turn-helix domain-containing protein [Nitrospirae bacterium]|nr:helix-turn-helix domain-containing protein [Nitrospirota bacterium]
MKTVAEYIKAKREEKELSARELAKTAGITGEHIRYIESGQRKTPSFDIVMKILKALHVDLQEFLQETGYLPVNVEPASLKKMRQIPIISWVTAGRWDAVSDNFPPGDADEWTESDVKGKNVFALRIKGDSMEPEFREGDVVIVNPHVEAKPGDYVIVKNDEEEATFKQLKKFGDTLVLHPLNSRYEDIELKKSVKYRIVGKVVKKEKRY